MPDMTDDKPDPAAMLKQSVARYRREKKRATEIKKHASEALAADIRTAYADGSGMKKADIIRAIDHEWSRTWVDRAIANTPADPEDQ